MSANLEYQRGVPQSVSQQSEKTKFAPLSKHDGLPPALVDLLFEVISMLTDVRSELERLRNNSTAPERTPALEPKEAFTTTEVAELLGKSAFTVREWCRAGRVHSSKRECGFGPHQEWLIAKEEVERIRNFGLLRARS